MRDLTFFAAVGLALTLGACAETRVSLATGPRDYLASDYGDVLGLWTRSASLVDFGEFDDHLTVTATYESWDFRWAYIARYADDYRLTTLQKEALLQEAATDEASNHRFYIAMYGTKPRWTKLGTPGSAWVVRMIDDAGNESEPIEIKQTPRPGALETRYFPYTTPWRSVFRVRFLKHKGDGTPVMNPSAKWIGLRFAGPEGHQDIRWLIKTP